MNTVLFIYALGLSVGIAFLGTLITFLFDVPNEGEEVIPWSELDAEGMSEREIEEKIKEGFAKKKLYGIDRFKYIFAFPSAFAQLFLEMFFPCFVTAVSMVYVVKYMG